MPEDISERRRNWLRCDDCGEVHDRRQSCERAAMPEVRPEAVTDEMVEAATKVVRARYDPHNTFAAQANVTVKPRELVRLILEAGLAAREVSKVSPLIVGETPARTD